MAYWSSGDFDKKKFIEEAKLYGLSITEVDVKFGYHARDISIYSAGGSFSFCFHLIEDKDYIKIPIIFGQIPGCCGAGIFYSIGLLYRANEIAKILDCLAKHFNLGFIQTITVDSLNSNEFFIKNGFVVVNKVRNLRYGEGNILTIRVKNYGETVE